MVLSCLREKLSVGEITHKTLISWIVYFCIVIVIIVIFIVVTQSPQQQEDTSSTVEWEQSCGARTVLGCDHRCGGGGLGITRWDKRGCAECISCSRPQRPVNIPSPELITDKHCLNTFDLLLILVPSVVGTLVVCVCIAICTCYTVRNRKPTLPSIGKDDEQEPEIMDDVTESFENVYVTQTIHTKIMN